MGSNRAGCSADAATAPLPPPPPLRLLPASLDPKPPCLGPEGPGANSSTDADAILDSPPPHPFTSLLSCRDDTGVVTGLPGRANELPSPSASASWRCGPFCGLRTGTGGPGVKIPGAPSFGDPGGPRVGRGRSQERQRNLELSLEARTVGLGAFSSPPLAPARPFGTPALETRAASLRWVFGGAGGEKGLGLGLSFDDVDGEQG